MKGLSLWQPWATLVAIGAKRIETRCWSTRIRGDVVIHASKYRSADNVAICGDEPFRSVLQAALFPECVGAVPVAALFEALPRGVLLCICELKDCSPIAGGGARGYLVNGTVASGNEYAFGNYAPGRYGLELGPPRQLVAPVAFKAAQRFFEVPDAILGQTHEVQR